MSGNHSRNKGAAFERELVHVFREAMPGAEVRRGLQSRSGAEVADVECPVFHVEAKRGKKPNVRAALVQANGDAKPGLIPLAVIRDDHADAFVALSLDHFLDLIREWWTLGKR